MTKEKRPLKKPQVLSFNTTAEGKNEIERLAAKAYRKRSEFIELAARGIIQVDRSILEKPAKK